MFSCSILAAVVTWANFHPSLLPVANLERKSIEPALEIVLDFSPLRNRQC
jgi:hypothetical protein